MWSLDLDLAEVWSRGLLGSLLCGHQAFVLKLLWSLGCGWAAPLYPLGFGWAGASSLWAAVEFLDFELMAA